MATITGVADGVARSWLVSSSWVGGVIPTSADDVIIPNNSWIFCAASTTALCRSLTVQAGGTFDWGASSNVLRIGDSSGGALSIDAAATIASNGFLGQLQFLSTSDNGGTGWPITTNGKTLGTIGFNGIGGKWVLQDSLICAGFSHVNGHFDSNSQDMYTQGWSQGSGTTIISLGSTNWTIEGSGNAITFNILGTHTYIANTATVTTTSGTGIATVGADMNGTSLIIGGSGLLNNWNISNGTWANITRTVGGLTLTGSNLTVTDTLTVAGTNSTTNRALITSDIPGTQRFITAGSISFTDVDFMDVGFVGPKGSVVTSDSFNRADGVLGDTDAADGGTPKTWTVVQGTFTISSNSAVRTTSSTDDRAIVEVGSSDQLVEITLGSPLETSTSVMARYNTVSGDYYYANVSSTGAAALGRVHFGNNQIGSTIAAGTFSPGDVLGISIRGNVIQLLKNGVPLLTTTDGWITSGTHAGIRYFQTSTTPIDNFKVTEISTATGTRLGDCLGNSGIVFDASRNLYAVASGNFSNSSMWSLTSGGASGEHPPLAQDNVYLDANSPSGTYTIDIVNVCSDFDATGFTQTLTWSNSIDPYRYYGDFTFPLSGATWTLPNTIYVRFMGRGNHTLTTPQWPNPVNHRLDFWANGGTYSLGADLICSRTAFGSLLICYDGLFDTNGYDVTVNAIQIFGGSIDLNDSIVTIEGTTILWQYSSGDITADEATIIISYPDSRDRPFVGGGYSYGSLEYSVEDSSGTLVISGANSFGSLHIGAGRQVTLPSGEITRIGMLYLNGSNDEMVIIRSSSSEIAATIENTGEIDELQYVDIQDIVLYDDAYYLGSSCLVRSNVRGNAKITSPRYGLMV